jgi:hypothetical protein
VNAEVNATGVLLSHRAPKVSGQQMHPFFAYRMHVNELRSFLIAHYFVKEILMLRNVLHVGYRYVGLIQFGWRRRCSRSAPLFRYFLRLLAFSSLHGWRASSLFLCSPHRTLHLIQPKVEFLPHAT